MQYLTRHATSMSPATMDALPPDALRSVATLLPWRDALAMAATSKGMHNALVASTDAAAMWTARTRKLALGEDAPSCASNDQLDKCALVTTATALANAEVRILNGRTYTRELCKQYRIYRHARSLLRLMMKAVRVKRGDIADSETTMGATVEDVIEQTDRNVVVVVPIHPLLTTHLFGPAADAAARAVGRPYIIKQLNAAMERGDLPVSHDDDSWFPGDPNSHPQSIPLGEAISVPVREDVWLADDVGDDDEVVMLPKKWYGSHIVLTSIVGSLRSSEREQVLRTCYHSSLKLAWNLRDPAKASDRKMYASSRIQEYPEDTSPTQAMRTQIVMSAIGTGAAGFELGFATRIAISTVLSSLLNMTRELADAVAEPSTTAQASSSTELLSSLHAVRSALDDTRLPRIKMLSIDLDVCVRLIASRMWHIARPWRIPAPFSGESGEVENNVYNYMMQQYESDDDDDEYEHAVGGDSAIRVESNSEEVDDEASEHDVGFFDLVEISDNDDDDGALW